jgi:hypothetical protein
MTNIVYVFRRRKPIGSNIRRNTPGFFWSSTDSRLVFISNNIGLTGTFLSLK